MPDPLTDTLTQRHLIDLAPKSPIEQTWGIPMIGGISAVPQEAAKGLGLGKDIVDSLLERLPKGSVTDAFAESVRKPQAWYNGVTAQPKPGTPLYSALEKLGEISGSGGQLLNGEHELLKHFTDLIR